MRIASFALLILALIAFAAFAALAACGPKKTPQGPAPEYEEPPAPSWYDAGSADAGSNQGKAR